MSPFFSGFSCVHELRKLGVENQLVVVSVRWCSCCLGWSRGRLDSLRNATVFGRVLLPKLMVSTPVVSVAVLFLGFRTILRVLLHPGGCLVVAFFAFRCKVSLLFTFAWLSCRFLLGSALLELVGELGIAFLEFSG